MNMKKFSFKEKVAKAKLMLSQQRPQTEAMAKAFRAFDEPKHKKSDATVGFGLIILLVMLFGGRIAAVAYENPAWNQSARLAGWFAIATAVLWIAWYLKRYKAFLRHSSEQK